MARKKKVEQSEAVRTWLGHISTYERAFKEWEGRVEKILKRYKDENRQGQSQTDNQAKFNILWSNVQTLVPATFARLPKPEVSRRFKDNDPVGRVASLILERALDYEIEHYPFYREAMNAVVHDRFLGGRGTAWIRYEPKFKTALQAGAPEDGAQVTEDVENEGIEETEQLDYECAPMDYVHWRDFGHVIARTWEEVPAVWRRVYMGREALVERFGEEIGKAIPMDSRPEDLKARPGGNEYQEDLKAAVYEIWAKEENKVIWLCKSYPEVLDERTPGPGEGDPPELAGFWPCPKPLFATLTNESLVPVPDFTLYQDQAMTLDTLADRIFGLVKQMQVKGGYDSSIPELARIFTEGGNGDLIPIKNWAAYAEKGGLGGALDLVDLKPIAEALTHCYQAMEQVKSQVYEITGISDIIRGNTEASETATAQEIKGRYASLRLKAYQMEVAMFATEALRIMAQIMVSRYEPQTLIEISAASQLLPEDQQLIPQALMLLKDKPLRNFRIEVAADSLVQLDEQGEKQSRLEFLQALGGFMKEAQPVVAQAPEIAPLAMEMMKFGVQAFKAGKTLEGAVDQAAEMIKQKAAQPKQPPPDPAMEKVKADAQAEQMRMQFEQQRAQAEMALEQRRIELEMQAEAQRAQLQAQIDEHRNQMEAQRATQQAMIDQAFEKWKAMLEAQTKVEVAEISANATLTAAQEAAAKPD